MHDIPPDILSLENTEEQDPDVHNHQGDIDKRYKIYTSSIPEIDPRVRHIFIEIFSPLPLIQEEQVVSYWRKNGHLILVNCLWEACPGTVWLSN